MVQNIGGGERNTPVLILGSILCMYIMNDYNQNNVICNRTSNINKKVHHQL
jgi:hypothetical protein